MKFVTIEVESHSPDDPSLVCDWGAGIDTRYGEPTTMTSFTTYTTSTVQLLRTWSSFHKIWLILYLHLSLLCVYFDLCPSGLARHEYFLFPRLGDEATHVANIKLPRPVSQIIEFILYSITQKKIIILRGCPLISKSNFDQGCSQPLPLALAPFCPL